MPAKKMPYFPLWAGDFLSSSTVAEMTTEEVGAYLLLLLHGWLRGGIPNNTETLVRFARLPASEASNRLIERVVALAWKPDADDPRLLRNDRQEEERGKAGSLYQRRCESIARARAARIKQAEGQVSGMESVLKSRLSAGGESESESESESQEAKQQQHDDRARDTAIADFVADFPAAYRSAVAGAFRASRSPSELLASLRGMLAGMTDYPVTHAILGQALQELAIAGGQPTMKALRAFVRGCTETRPPTKPAKPSSTDIAFAAIDAYNRKKAPE